MGMDDIVHCDLLVIGSGFAGLWAAIAARDGGLEKVAIVDKGAVGLSSMSRMSAGATVYCLPRFDPERWMKAFIRAQGYLSRQDMLEEIIGTSHSRLRSLEAWGVEYQRNPLTRSYLTLPSRGLDHVRMMVLPRWRDRTGGTAVVSALLAQVRKRGIARYGKIIIAGLLCGGGRVCGAVGIDRLTGKPVTFRARAVILAAADCSFRGHYACVEGVTGDAFKLAYDAGVRLSNMEFLAVNTGPPRYGFEGTGIAARCGARFLDGSGKAFMRAHHAGGDKAEICYLVQAMADAAEGGSGPPFYLDMSRLPGRWIIRKALLSIGGWMPLNIAKLREMGEDIFTSPQEWGPAVQSLRGGVRAGADCMSDLPGLFAAGTSLSVDPGLFNGWSSMLAMWSGEKAGREAARFVRDSGDTVIERENVERMRKDVLAPSRPGAGTTPDVVCRRLQEAVFPYLICILKREDRLQAALQEVERIRDEDVPSLRAPVPHELVKAHETVGMVLAAELFLRASLERRESRGDHLRQDHPRRDNAHWLQWVNLSKGGGGEPRVELERVPLSRYPMQPAPGGE
ncbi:MAG: FAD-binding protein [Actinobacteria bacterium]|jgi:succinate dehydrogenase/fumarate reductase flavoprotein subunit|nr:MAG: FAD-binding protein [Actinomycetota bacterium]